MSKKNKNPNSDLSIKNFLTSAEQTAFIDMVVSNILDEEHIDSYYEHKQIFINEATFFMYCNVNTEELDSKVNIYGMLDIIKEHINLSQYGDILAAIDEGIAYELNIKAKDSLFDGMNQGNNEEAMSQIDAMIEKVGGQEKFNKLLELATQTEIQQKAREEVKLEMINNKANKAK